MRPPMFEGLPDPTKVEQWLKQVDSKIFDVMGSIDEQRVKMTTVVLKREDDCWWDPLKRARILITQETFRTEFTKMFVPSYAQCCKASKITKLVQGSRIVA